MGVLEDVVINAKTAAENMGKEAGRLVDISKLRFSAADVQKEISKKFETLGRMVYDSHKSGNSSGSSFDEHIEGIDVLYQKLDEINGKINALSRKSSCSNCGFKNDENATFCSRCGTKLGDQHKNAEAPSAAVPSAEDSPSDTWTVSSEDIDSI